MLELKLNVSQAQYTKGETVEGKVTLRNAGSEPVKVNGRMALNAPFSPDEFREIALTLNDPAGRPLDFQTKVNIGEPAAGDFKTLKPGEAIEQSYDLGHFYDLQKPGMYSVQAVYQNQAEPAAPNGTSVWTGEVKSDVAKFTVL